MVKFDKLEDAFSFVNSAPYGEHKAWLCLEDDEILWFSGFLDFEEQDNVESRLEHGKWIEIPHKNVLLEIRYLQRIFTTREYSRH